MAILLGITPSESVKVRHWRDLLMLNALRAPVGNMRIFIRIWIRILHVFFNPQIPGPQICIIPDGAGCEWQR